MRTKKRVASCCDCVHLGVAHYVADPSMKWYACMHPEFKDMFSDGRALDLEQESIAGWCPKPEPLSFGVMLAKITEINGHNQFLNENEGALNERKREI